MEPLNHILSAINRWRRCPPKAESAERQAGYRAGREWATLWRDPVELELIAQLANSGGIKVPEDGDAGEWLATQMGEALGFNPSHPDFLYRAKSVLFTEPDAEVSGEFVRGFIEGAVGVWRVRQQPGDV
jgi:hypothetical protein